MRFFALLLLCLGLATPALAQDQDTGPVVQQPAGTIIVPDQFLRRWDPVTVFFDHDMGAQPGTPDDTPGRLVSMAPPQPGAWTWLDGRTLQFRPAEPWPPLSQFAFTIQGKTIQLSRLLDPTVSTDPANGATGLEQMKSLALVFSEPLDVKALAGMLDIAISPLPGLDPTQARHLTPADFDIKTMERTARSDNATYIVEFHQPIPDGMNVSVSIGLSPIPGLVGTVETLDFATATAFRPTLLGCADQRVPLSAAGTVYDKTAALACNLKNNNPDNNNADNGDGSDNQAADNADDSNTPDQPATPAADLPVTTPKQPAVGVPDTAVAPGTGATPSPPRQIVVEFSANPAPMDPLTARNFIRITPPVDGVQTSLSGNDLQLTAAFKTGTLYQIALQPVPMRDVNGRPLVMTGGSAVWVYWPPEQNFLSLSAGNGVVERYGPQMIPLAGRGYANADIRIATVNPLDRSFWPFPATPVTTNDNAQPPAPGEQAAAWSGAAPIDQNSLASEIAGLGSPSISTLAPLPLTPLGPSARFGLDLSDAFARIAGRHNPGTYLIGMRALDQPGNRAWMRVQVTDLSLTTVEEERALRFVVTSLNTAQPVAGAKVEVDGTVNNKWVAMTTGATDADGAYVWHVPGGEAATLSRIVITKEDDTLVVDPNQPPDRYTADGWSAQTGNWLSWVTNTNLDDRHPAPQTLCHIFTERPIYRPTDPVHIKAYIRTLADGLLTPGGQRHKIQLMITGPDSSSDTWQYDVTPDADGNLHYLFDDQTTDTGTYQAELDVDGTACATVKFIKDAYRLPRFQITMNGPDEIPLDRQGTIGMTAMYYAGGPAGGRPVRFRVTEFPYAFAPAPRPGFVYATSSIYQADFGAQATAAVESQATTDKEGRAAVTIDPTQEASNAPRRYVVEATVTGDDDKTVTNTQDVLALPSFVLALQAPRYLPQATQIPVQVLMVDANGKPLAGKPITLRLLRRQWSSILQASDFSNGQAKYQTVVVDEKLIERTVTSGTDAVKLNLPIDKAGVYIVQLEASDALGRLQTVSVDLFAAGSNPVSWSRPPATVFNVTTDKPDYVPGDTAKLILQSPFQTGRALAIVERPDGANQYQWLDITNGYGVFSLPIEKSFMPRLPVHFVLMRGRLPGDGGTVGLLDLRRPQTIAATAWVGVKPVKNIVTVAVSAPAGALPGSTINLTVKLSDDTGKPISGQVTLWLIDQAVLALAQEAPLNPLPDFIRDRGSDLAVSDTRNWPFGLLPLDEDPGGDVGAGDMGLLNKVTIRKNFNPMPYYNPALIIGPSGTATVSIKLPDDLTIFRIRAVAVSGTERFGFAAGQIAVRLPVIIEPNLPRFVRPGDSFNLAGLGRIVTGPGGPGQAQLAVQGLNVAGPLTAKFNWTPGTSQAFGFPATVPSPGYTTAGALSRISVRVTMAIERDSDKATDAFQVDLPIEPDRDPVHQRALVDLTSPQPLNLPAIDGTARPGTIRRQILVSTEPQLVRLAAGLNYLMDYPFGCTEQRVSLARAELAAQRFSAALDGGTPDRTARDVNQTLAWITTATDGNGLVAFWPGDPGVVTLTAWSVEFMVEAKHAGYTVDPVEMATLTHALQQALRSDYPYFVSNAAFEERAWALSALAYAGDLDRDYADELARERDQMSLEGIAMVSNALEEGGATDDALLKPLQNALFSGLIIKLRNGAQVYGGLQEGDASTDYPQIFPSETRTLAEMLRATASTNDPRRQLIVDALTTLGAGDGWGSTNADAEALLALTAYLKTNTGAPPQEADVTAGGALQKYALSGADPLQRETLLDGGAVSITAPNATTTHPLSVQADLIWLPTPDGSHVAPLANGFVVTADSDLITPNAPPIRVRLDHAGAALAYHVGDIVEDHVQVINPQDRAYVAITVPLAAGMEPLDPSLKTAPPEATPTAPPTLAPSYVAFLDDRVSYFYDDLPAGTYDFYFRTQAAVPGRFIQPAPQAVMMYDDSVSGGGAGAVVTVAAK
jgi:uncharacterized protein YfaS (alpha-2-macroglobulin family)